MWWMQIFSKSTEDSYHWWIFIGYLFGNYIAFVILLGSDKHTYISKSCNFLLYKSSIPPQPTDLPVVQKIKTSFDDPVGSSGRFGRFISCCRIGQRGRSLWRWRIVSSGGIIGWQRRTRGQITTRDSGLRVSHGRSWRLCRGRQRRYRPRHGAYGGSPQQGVGLNKKNFFFFILSWSFWNMLPLSR